MGTIGEIPTQPPVQGQIDIKGLSQPLQTSFEYSPLNPRTNENVTFDASGSSQNDFNITDYVWNFGDGNITSVRVPVVTHCYSTPQTYNVTLTVTDIDGLNSAVLKTITIEPAVAAVPLDVTPYAIAIVALVIVAAAGVYFIKIRKPRDENKTRRKR
jgi:PKD repeat protein